MRHAMGYCISCVLHPSPRGRRYTERRALFKGLLLGPTKAESSLRTVVSGKPTRGRRVSRSAHAKEALLFL